MPNRFVTMAKTMTWVALLSVAMPEPVVLDVLGVGIASIGLGLICQPS